jgi:hypothetical protein
MGRQQFFRGDPSLKQYYLVNDFTGGINTTSVDERTETNEFRELLNVELSKKGMLQNRKGWGNAYLLNQLITDKGLFNSIPKGNIALLKVVKDEGNLLQILTDWENRGIQFGQEALPSSYTLEILFIYENNGVKLGLLTLANPITSGGTVTDPNSKFEVIANIMSGSFTNDRSLTSIETAEYSDFIYFTLSSLNSNILGLGEYNIATKEFRIVRDDERITGTVEQPVATVYKPNAYEISKVGFNVLSNTPLTDISERAGFFNISGLFLTTYDVTNNQGALTLNDTQTPIFAIPPNGKVTLNVIYTGADITLTNFLINFYVLVKGPDGIDVEKPLSTILDAHKFEDGIGIARFAYSIDVQNNPQIYVRIRLFSGITLVAAKEAVLAVHKFSSTAEMMEYFNEPEHSTFVAPDTNTTNRMFLYRRFSDTPYVYNQINTVDLSSLGALGSANKVFTANANNGLLYDGSKIAVGNKWAEATEAQYEAAPNKTNVNLQDLTSDDAEDFSCEDFEDVTITNISDQTSAYYLNPNAFTVGQFVRINRTHIVEQSTGDPYWDSSTLEAYNNAIATQGQFFAIPTKFLSSGGNSTAFNALTPAQIGALSGRTDPGVIVRLEGYFETAKFWDEIPASPIPTFDTTITYTGQTYSSCSNFTSTSEATLLNWLNANQPVSGKAAGFTYRMRAQFSTTTGGSWASGTGGVSGGTYDYGNSGTSTCPTTSTLLSWVNFEVDTSGFTQTTTIQVTSSRTISGTKSFASSSSVGYTGSPTIFYQSSFFSCGASGLSALQMANAAASAESYNTGTVIRVVEATSDGALCSPEVGYVTVVESGGGTTSCTVQSFTYTPPTQSSGTCTTPYRYFRVLGGVQTPTSPQYRYALFVQTTTSTTTLCDPVAYPESYRYFKVEQENLGNTIPILTFDRVNNVGTINYMFEGVKTPVYYYNTTIWGLSTPENYQAPKQIVNLSVKIPSVTNLYLAGIDANVEANYYRYIGGTSGTITDFTNVAFVAVSQEVTYNDIYEVRVTDNPQPVEQLDTRSFRMLEIGARLVLYKNNVIWFSDLYQFDYIPNYNYIILPLTPDDRITSINYFKGSYMIFTKERIYKMSGTFGGQDFQVQLVSDSIGCISPYSVRGFNNTLVFMSKDGLYRVKQNYYQNGLENVEKIDKQLDNITPYNRDVFSVLYNEQYLLFYKYNTVNNYNTAPFNVLKMYYNLQAPQGYPYVKDKYTEQPQLIAKLENNMFTIKSGLFYRYDLGYTDFLPPGEVTIDQQKAALYKVKVRTTGLSFNYPTHEKKVKTILVKTNAQEEVPLYFNIYFDNNLVYSYRSFEVTRTGVGELTYNGVDVSNIIAGDEVEVLDTPSIVVKNQGLLGELELGMDKLGDTSTQVHRLLVGAKGKTITVEMEQLTDKYFGIQDIGYVYKMGKAREDR